MVKVRFAPSPTGYLHVGNLRTALANYLFARKEGGTLVLRIEDTDMERSDAAYEASILDDLKWLGIKWDEGPYRQSDRTPLYRERVLELLEKGAAYKCFCSKERLGEMRAEALNKGRAPRYDGTCRRLPPETARLWEKEGKPHVVRFKSTGEAIRIMDLIHGEISFPAHHVDDFILMKQEMTPSYNFAVTVDDMAMGITHVIRGADHVSNTPKQIMLFRAFGGTVPQYAHHSLLTGQDGKPLSKRHGATQVREFRDMGILRQALINYVAIIGRSMKHEIMDEDELIGTFALKSLSPSDSLFDMEKLLWFNREYIKRLPPETLLLDLSLPEEMRDRVVLLQENARTLNEIRGYLDIFDGGDVSDEGLAYLSGIRDLSAIVASVGTQVEEGGRSFDEIARGVEARWGLKKRDIFMLFRVVFTGRIDGPPLKVIFPLIGKDAVTKRIARIAQQLPLP